MYVRISYLAPGQFPGTVLLFKTKTTILAMARWKKRSRGGCLDLGLDLTCVRTCVFVVRAYVYLVCVSVCMYIWCSCDWLKFCDVIGWSLKFIKQKNSRATRKMAAVTLPLTLIVISDVVYICLLPNSTEGEGRSCTLD